MIKQGDIVKRKKYGKVKMTVREVIGKMAHTIWSVKHKGLYIGSFREAKINIDKLKIIST